VSGALLASAGFVWLGAAPSVGCYCWPDHCSGCSLCSPSKKCLEKRCINILESNHTPKLYAVIFIYLYLSDEVVDKVPKQSHDSHQALTSMQQNIYTTQLTTLAITWVAPSECGTRRESDCSLQAPCLNPGPRRWLTRCLCLMRRGRWPDPLPSSCSLGWWCSRSAAGCGESRSRAEQPLDECLAPPSHLGGAPSPSWGYPSSPIGLELILLPIGQEMVDGVLQSTLVAMDPRGDGLLGGVSHSVSL
jgi:hypothetical protein